MISILAGAVVLSATTASFAACRVDSVNKRWRLLLSGGYATTAMTDVNNDYRAVSATPPTKIENGWLGALEGLYRPSCGLALGARVEYLQTNQGKANVFGADIKEDTSLVPVMVGGRYSLKKMSEKPGNTFCDNCGLTLGAFAGWATAWGQTSDGSTIKYSGSGFAGDLLFGWEHRLYNNWKIGVDLGYRYAPIPEMKTTEEYPLLGVSRGATIIDHGGNTLKYDFSGLIATVGIGYAF